MREVKGRALNLLGLLQMKRALYKESETALSEALAIRESVLPPGHRLIVQTRSNLALLYQAQGIYDKAEALYLRSLAEREKTIGKNDFGNASLHNNLGTLYHDQHKLDEAIASFHRALAIHESNDPESPATATAAANLGGAYRDKSICRNCQTVLAGVGHPRPLK